MISNEIGGREVLTDHNKFGLRYESAEIPGVELHAEHPKKH